MRTDSGELTPEEKRYVDIHDNDADPDTRHKTYEKWLALSPEEHLQGAVGNEVLDGRQRERVQRKVDAWLEEAQIAVQQGSPMEDALRSVLGRAMEEDRLLDPPKLSSHWSPTNLVERFENGLAYQVQNHLNDGETVRRTISEKLLPIGDLISQSLRHILDGEDIREEMAGPRQGVYPERLFNVWNYAANPSFPREENEISPSPCFPEAPGRRAGPADDRGGRAGAGVDQVEAENQADMKLPLANP